MSESVYFYRERLKACEQSWENYKKHRDENMKDLQEFIEEPKQKQEFPLDEGMVYDYVRDLQSDGYEFY